MLRLHVALVCAASAFTSSPAAPHPSKLARSAEPAEPGWTDVTATVALPVPREAAFDLYSQLGRHPAWSPWLRSVENATDAAGGARLTRWVLAVPGGARVAWLARSVDVAPPARLAWESVPGVRQRGDARFAPAAGGGCELTVRIRYRAPAVLRRVPALDRVVRRVLRRSLERFRALLVHEVEQRAVERRSVEAGPEARGARAVARRRHSRLRPWTWERLSAKDREARGRGRGRGRAALRPWTRRPSALSAARATSQPAQGAAGDPA